MNAIAALRFDLSAWPRVLAAGSAWGAAVAAGFFAMGYWQCGLLPCPDDAAVTTLVCIGTGILAIGPLAAFAPQTNNG